LYPTLSQSISIRPGVHENKRLRLGGLTGSTTRRVLNVLKQELSQASVASQTSRRRRGRRVSTLHPPTLGQNLELIAFRRRNHDGCDGLGYLARSNILQDPGGAPLIMPCSVQGCGKLRGA
jgi:hypothetical protein